MSRQMKPTDFFQDVSFIHHQTTQSSPPTCSLPLTIPALFTKLRNINTTSPRSRLAHMSMVNPSVFDKI